MPGICELICLDYNIRGIVACVESVLFLVWLLFGQCIDLRTQIYLYIMDFYQAEYSNWHCFPFQLDYFKFEGIFYFDNFSSFGGTIFNLKGRWCLPESMICFIFYSQSSTLTCVRLN